MRWDEAINSVIEDEEASYDGWFVWNERYERVPINFYADYRHTMFGMDVGMNKMGNKFEQDEVFNITLKYTFPNITLIDDYTSMDEKMKFFCECCKNRFEKTGSSVLNTGCPRCYKSKYKGEELLAEILNKEEIEYERQISYGCINPKTEHELYYDFIVTYNNKLIFIEVQGGQHYKPVDFFGGEEGYEYGLYKDEVKKKYAEENGVFIELDYREHNLNLLKERIYKELNFLFK